MREVGEYYGTYDKGKSKILFVFLHIEINKLYFKYWGSLADQVAAP